ncbi:MAG: hypothetical protein M1823_001227 [Watsoniomyces obsoletus]|nr:MAG: hypothetical protein M1823_001227 [Watsoniomyces obsoletus]
MPLLNVPFYRPPVHKPPYPDPGRFYERIEFSSCPKMTKEEYDAASMDFFKPVFDEPITVLGRDPLGNRQTLMINRNTLYRFPVFQRFFESEHYYPKMGIQLWLLKEDRCLKYFNAVITCANNVHHMDSILSWVRAASGAQRVLHILKLYRFAVKLQAPHVVDVLVGYLRALEGQLDGRSVIEIAQTSYLELDESKKLREWFLAILPVWLRPLLSDFRFRRYVRDAPSALAADLWERTGNALLTGTFGHAGMLGPRPPPILDQPPFSGTVMWRDRPAHENGCLARGDQLVNCSIVGDYVYGETLTYPERHERIHRDAILLRSGPSRSLRGNWTNRIKHEEDQESEGPSADGDTEDNEGTRRIFNPKDEDDEDDNEDVVKTGHHDDREDHVERRRTLNPPRSARSTGNLGKASKLLGIDAANETGGAHASHTSTRPTTPTNNPGQGRKRRKVKSVSGNSSPSFAPASDSGSPSAPLIKREESSPPRNLKNFISGRFHPVHRSEGGSKGY